MCFYNHSQVNLSPKAVFIITLIALFSFVHLCYAQDEVKKARKAYITEKLRIGVRAGMGTDYKIISLLNIGQEVKVIKEENGWTLIKLPDGREGYVLSRYITKKMPLIKEAQEIKTKYEALQKEMEGLTAEKERLININTSLEKKIKTVEEELNKCKSEYGILKNESKDYLSLKKEFQRVSIQLKETKEKLSKCEKESESRNLLLRGFIAGGGMVLIGFILGYMYSSARKRKTSLFR